MLSPQVPPITEVIPCVCNEISLNLNFELSTFTFLAITTFKRRC